jgi:hypothetical protein
MLRVKNEKDLLNILRVISSEAVGLSKKKFMNENADPTLDRYQKQLKQDQKMYGSLDEQEKEEPEEEVEEKPAAEPPKPAKPDSSSVGASFDSVVSAINNLRSGKSLRDSSIKSQAQVYYDKLSDDERTTLLVFLKALSDIIAGQVTGQEAQDPSDPPASLNITSDKEKDEPEEEPEESEEPAAEESEEPPAESEAPAEEEGEDTTPPIKVNESQDLALLRKKVRRMMLRG